ncbi:MAG: hypothetical protein HOF85_10145, partial [Acidiferrobacteraceae bacterium]|nr:hypothetical protein [Acidiferrobacteraceae bacterium]
TEHNRDGVPGLQDAPFLQYFFSQRDISEFQKSVLILLTPRHTQCPSSCNWNKERVDLKEDLAHLFGYVKRRICGIASAWFPLSFV